MIRSLGIALCVVSLACLGCGSGGPKLGEVSGTVTMEGTPMANVLVTFTPEGGGRPSSGKTNDSGVYTLAFGDTAGALVGTHKVSVTSLKTAATSANSEMRSDDPAYASQAMGGSKSDYDSASNTEAIPAKYNTATELTYDVKKGSNTYDIPLTKN